MSREDNHFVIRIEKQNNQIICTGEKFLVDRLLSYVQDFFDSNTFYSQQYGDFSYEDLEFFRKVIKKKLEQFAEKFKIKFHFETKKICKDLATIEIIKLNVTTNKIKHERCQNFLNECLKEKYEDVFKLKDNDVMEYFYETKGLNDILNLEKTFECAIFLPNQLAYFRESQAKKVIESTSISVSDSKHEEMDQTIYSFIAYFYAPNVKNVSFKYSSIYY